MRKNKKLIVFTLILVELISIFFMYKSNKPYEKLDNVSIKKNTDNKLLAMYVKSGNKYIEYDSDTFPTNATVNTSMSKCTDINGEVVPDVLSQDEDGTVKLTSNKTLYCYIYFDRLPAPEKACTSGNSSLTQGTEYTDGTYTYQYKKQGTSSGWENIKDDGWGVKLTNPDSTDPITEAPCTTIDNKPVVSMSWMFYNSKAESIDLNNFNTKNVTNMNGMFYQSSASTLDLLAFNTSNVTNMEYIFTKAKAIEIIGYEYFDTSQVTNMYGIFQETNIPIINVSKWNTSNVLSMSAIFCGSKATEIIGYEDFDMTNVTNMRYMFENTKIPVIDVRNYVKDSSHVTDMEYMFSRAAATQILGYEDFDTSNVKAINSMFAGTKIPTIDVSKYKTQNVINMSNMFSGASATEIIGYQNFNTSKVRDIGYMFSNTNLETIDISNYDFSSLEVAAGMFYGTKATKIIGYEDMDVSRVSYMTSVFANTNIDTIDISKWDTSSVKGMFYMFQNSKATTINLGSINTSQVTNMESMFEGAQATTITGLNNLNTSKVTNMSYMFRNTVIPTLDLSSFDTTQVTSMTDMFKGAQATTGYAKTQEDANKFNASSNKPETLNFTVKSS